MNIRNPAGYLDPTAYEALKNISREEREQLRNRCVFICSPYAGNNQSNQQKVRVFLRFAIKQNTIPFATQLLYSQVLDDQNQEERRLGRLLALTWLKKCQEVWVFGYEISAGMKDEIITANQLEIPVRYFTKRCVEVNWV